MSDLSLAISIEKVLGYKPKGSVVSGALSGSFTLPQRLNVQPSEKISPIAQSHTVDVIFPQSSIASIGGPNISYADTGTGKRLL